MTIFKRKKKKKKINVTHAIPQEFFLCGNNFFFPKKMAVVKPLSLPRGARRKKMSILRLPAGSCSWCLQSRLYPTYGESDIPSLPTRALEQCAASRHVKYKLFSFPVAQKTEIFDQPGATSQYFLRAHSHSIPWKKIMWTTVCLISFVCFFLSHWKDLSFICTHTSIQYDSPYHMCPCHSKSLYYLYSVNNAFLMPFIGQEELLLIESILETAWSCGINLPLVLRPQRWLAQSLGSMGWYSGWILGKNSS